MYKNNLKFTPSQRNRSQGVFVSNYLVKPIELIPGQTDSLQQSSNISIPAREDKIALSLKNLTRCLFYSQGFFLFTLQISLFTFFASKNFSVAHRSPEALRNYFFEALLLEG